MDLSANINELLVQFYEATNHNHANAVDLIHDFEWKFLVLFAAFHMDHARCVKQLTPQPVAME